MYARTNNLCLNTEGSQMKWNYAVEQLKLMKHYFIASVLVFLAGMLMGALYSEQFQAFINTQLEALKRITDTLAEKPNQ